VPDRVVVFLDWQNVYKGAREAFCTLQAPHWQGQVDPVALAKHLAADSPFSRELKQVRNIPRSAGLHPGPHGIRCQFSPGRHVAAVAAGGPDDADPSLPEGLASHEPDR